MQITIQLFATFRNGRFKEEQRVFTDGITIGLVLAELGITENETCVTFVNGRHASKEQELNDGQVLAIFPLLGGG